MPRTHLVRASLDEGDGREVLLLRWFAVHCESGCRWDGGWRKVVERRGGRRAVGLGRLVRWGLFVVVLMRLLWYRRGDGGDSVGQIVSRVILGHSASDGAMALKEKE